MTVKIIYIQHFLYMILYEIMISYGDILYIFVIINQFVITFVTHKFKNTK